MEGFVFDHPIWTVMIVLGILYTVYRGAKKLLADDLEDIRNPRRRRLD